MDGVTRIIIYRLDPKYFNKAIIKLVRDQESRKILGTNGKKFLNNRFNFNESV